jgi:S-methylmethionine-dependent homocysteine/selenocysteine methylase
MAKYRNHLPQLEGSVFLTDGGIETTLIFHEGLELPYFAAFHLLKDETGREALRRYFHRHASIARTNGAGFILESATWRASADWGERLGYSAPALAGANRQAVDFLLDLRKVLETERSPMPISGCIGPRGDGYDPGAVMSPQEAEAYHAAQIRTFAETEADLVTAITMTNANEAVGVARAAKAAHMPVVISFTLEVDGKLPTGQPLGEAIEEVDAVTDRAPTYYMINCAHPTHFDGTLDGGAWTERLRGIRANASKRSHAELDAAPDLDDGNPVELGAEYAALRRRHPWINVLGGCCGTDHRHIEQICAACKAGVGGARMAALATSPVETAVSTVERAQGNGMAARRRPERGGAHLTGGACMRRSTPIGIAAAALLLAGGLALAPEARASLQVNGLGVNGLGLNGRELNGLHLNGIRSGLAAGRAAAGRAPDAAPPAADPNRLRLRAIRLRGE